MPTKKVNHVIEDKRKKQIYDGALAMISQKGTAKTTLDQVAKAAGLSKGAITYYYASKDELFVDIFNTFFHSIFEKAEVLMSREQTPVEKLTSFLWLIDENESDNNYLYPLFFELIHLAMIDNQYQIIFHEWVNGWINLLSRPLSEIMDNEQEITDTARTISSIYQGIAVRWYLDRSSHSSEWARNAIKQTITKLIRP